MIIRSLAVAAVLLAVYWGVSSILEPEEITTNNAMVEVALPDLPGQAKEGETAFNTNCASCHGKNAAGRDGIAPPLVHKIYEPGHHGDMSFIRAAKNGVRQHHWRFGNMPPVDGIEDRDIASIIAYVRILQRANGIN